MTVQQHGGMQSKKNQQQVSQFSFTSKDQLENLTEKRKIPFSKATTMYTGQEYVFQQKLWKFFKTRALYLKEI